MRLIVFGGKGWIGNQFCELLEKSDHQFIIPDVRADDTESVKKLLTEYQPSHVVSFIGRTHGEGINTIDYLELPGKLNENIRDNLMSPVQLAIMCARLNIHFTQMGTGCIFSNPERPEDHPYDESSLPDFFGSSYSIVKGFTDRLMHLFEESTLNVRIRMPITDAMHPRNFITKIVQYEKICSISNSMTVLPELLPIMLDMVEKRMTGTINLTNPGCISHNEILEMYKDIIDPEFTWQNFSMEEQDSILKSKRSNNMLDTSKLQTLYPRVRDIKTAVCDCILKMKA